MEIRSTSDYKEISVEEALELLETSPNGLTESEARRRLEKFGENKLEEKKRNPLIELLSRYWGPMPWLLELAIALSFVLAHYLEAVIIFVLLTVNAILGFRQARSSNKALEFLKKRLAIKTKLLRDGKWATKDASEIVLGDIFVVGLGDLVPADAKILEGELSVDQSALTGESMSVSVLQSKLIFSGSVVKRGEAKCVTINTGANTYFGRTAELVKVAKPQSHQQEIMMDIIKYLMYVGVAALALVSADALLINADIVYILTLAAIFLIGAVPVALPTVLTIVQAVGSMELAKKQVLVTRLDSIEDAASMDVLCIDKTGTITLNHLSVIDLIPFSGYKKDDVAKMASLASKDESKDMIDIAVIQHAKNMGVDISSYKQVEFTPFEPSTKRSEAVVEDESERFKVIKGAPQIIASMCRRMDRKNETRMNELVEELSLKGYRILAVARSEGGNLNNLQLVGLLSLADPIRPDSKKMIEEAKAEGIKPLMLTGDNISVAREIASQAAIGDRIIRMASLADSNEADQAKTVEECDGLAEIYPEDKFRIVKLLQSRGHIVGMTGDGVNDAPALRQAEVGIAVSNSTDVAKASASMVLTEEGVGVIIDAIKTSRQIYQRMLSWVLNKVTKVMQFIGVLTLGFFWLHDVVISLLGMVLLVFANDFVTMALATDNVERTTNPNAWNVKNITLASLVIGMFLVVQGAIVVIIGISYFHLEMEGLRTLMMLNLVFVSQFRVYIMRERRHFWSSKPGRELLVSTAATTVAFALLGVYGIIIPSLALYQVLLVLGFSALFTLGLDPVKYHVFRRFGL